MICRILLACLKYLARCPCPRCKINKDKIIEMGTRADDYRRNQTRVDDDDVQWRISLARQWIFERGMPLTSTCLDRILAPLSLTPTRVCLNQSCAIETLLTLCRVPSLSSCASTMSISTHSLCQISCMSLSWVCGSRSSHT